MVAQDQREPTFAASEPDSHRASRIWQVAGVFVGGVTVNWLSNFFAPAPIIVLVAVVATLVILLRASPESRVWRALSLTRASRDVISLALGASLVGATVGGISILPVFPAERYTMPWGWTWASLLGVDVLPSVTWNYELGAVAAICVMGGLATARGARFAEVISFGVAALTGMLLVYALFEPSTEFAWSLVGWTLAYLILASVVGAMPDMARVFSNYFRIGASSQTQVMNTGVVESSAPSTTGPDLDDEGDSNTKGLGERM